MKIAMVGCGALGSYYGAKLVRDGRDVHFLLRSDFEAVRRNGVRIRSPEGDFHVNPRCARTPAEIGPCDLVIIGLKTTANAEFGRLVTPLVADHTAILTLQNGLGNEAQLASLFGAEKVLGGLCFVCLNRIEPGVIVHLGHGRIVLGEYQRWPEPRTHDIASMIRHSGVPCKVTDNLEAAHWEKLVWNIPFNGLGVASCVGYDAVLGGEITAGRVLGECLSTDKLLSDPKWEQLVRELMRETIRAAQAMGFKVTDFIEDVQVKRTREMGGYLASTLIDFKRGQALELESLFLEPLRQAEKAGVAMPRLT
ncbi:MAG: 2-dehydropantoate 2-reductase, partial [Opitutaceae bacterium]|nr:2-dehydropantoate 2-reductase [Verrucomicrobiales bacterium]